MNLIGKNIEHVATSRPWVPANMCNSMPWIIRRGKKCTLYTSKKQLAWKWSYIYMCQDRYYILRVTVSFTPIYCHLFVSQTRTHTCKCKYFAATLSDLFTNLKPLNLEQGILNIFFLPLNNSVIVSKDQKQKFHPLLLLL